MNDFITLLIIISAIISFISKIFKKQKKEQGEKPQPASSPETPVWKLPWEEDLDDEYQIIEEEQIPQQKEFVVEPERQSFENSYAEKRAKYPNEVAEINDSLKDPVSQTKMASMGVNLNSPDDLKRGIILSEILGPCKANRKHK